MSKKNDKAKTKEDAVCPHCGFDCRDKDSLTRHIGWVHRPEEKK